MTIVLDIINYTQELKPIHETQFTEFYVFRITNFKTVTEHSGIDIKKAILYTITKF